jgi:putative MATE family efflux protein
LAEETEKRQTIELRRETLARTVVALATPAVLENLLNTVVLFFPTMFVGRVGTESDVAAVGLGGTVIWLANGLFDSLAVSATAMVARFWGERRFSRAREVAAQALILSILFALFLMTILLPLADDLLRLLGAEEDVVRVGSHYIRIVLSTSLFSFPMMVANGVMRGAGDTRTPMWMTLVMNLWNVGVSALLVLGPGSFPQMGLAGAAWATASSRALGGVLSLIVLFSGRTVLRVRPAACFRWDGGLIWRIVRLALPNLGEQFISRAAYFTFMKIVTGLGTVALAAHTIAVRIESLSFMLGWGLSVATAALVGQALGAEKPQIAEMGIRRAMVMAMTLMSSLGLVFLLFGRHLVGLFGQGQDVLSLAGMAIAIAAAEQPFLGAQMVLAGSLRGAGDTRTPMWVTLFGGVFMRVSVVYLFAVVLDLGLAGVWWGTAADWFGRSALTWVLFRRGGWKRVKV